MTSGSLWLRVVAAAASAAVCAAGLHLLGIEPWTVVDDTTAINLPFVVVVLVAVAAVLFDVERSQADRHGAMRLPFVAGLIALPLAGTHAFALVTGVGTLAGTVLHPERQHPYRRGPIEVLGAVLAAEAAGLVYSHLSALVPDGWPWLAVPVTAALIVYSVLTSLVADLLLPLVSGRSASSDWLLQSVRGVPSHILGATIAVGAGEIITREAWSILLPALVPLYTAWRAYSGSSARPAARATTHYADVVQSPDHGVCVVDAHGSITAWNDALAALLDVRPTSAIGRSLLTGVPALAKTEVIAAVEDTLATRSARSLTRVPVAGTRSRVLTVSVLPNGDGALLVWRDVSDHATWERSLRDYAERYAIVAEAANDGLWELDLAGRALFVSSRWRTMLGLPAGEQRTTRDVWLERVHPDDRSELRQALDALAKGDTHRFEVKHRVRHESGSYRHVICRGVAVHDAGRLVRIGGSTIDVTETALAQDKIVSAESRDPLTGLLNRAAFVADLARRLNDFRARKGTRFATLYLDLDRFKVINDSLGHLVGDELLVEVSRRLETCLRPGDALARLGGDEFAILLHGLGDEMQANVIAFRLQEALHSPFPISGRDVVTSASIGIAFCREEYVSPEEIMRDADTAMYHAKAHGKARHELFDADMHARALDRLGLESDLRHAVKRSDFEVHYQPIVSLETRKCTGFESLVRWTRNGKAVSPADFVPMAEELGIIEPLGSWVMEEACRTFTEWQERYPDAGLEYITVNVSARQLVQQGFIYLVEQVVERNGMKPSDLRLEITETALMDAPQFVAQVLNELREFGVKIYLDDFGTGYSSLSHLHKLPVDALKIDRSFVRGLLLTDRPAIVESILALARTLHTSVVAEGIEEEQQAVELERLGCRLAQGYYFSKPVSAAAIEAILASGLPLGGPRAELPKPSRRSLVAVRPREIADPAREIA